MTIKGIRSLQSDWHRSLRIDSPEGRATTELTSDTGWWRGTNLYLHKSGTFVLHEGQDGCIYFKIDPVSFISSSSISCEKVDGLKLVEARDLQGSEGKAPPSKFYADLFHVGKFEETDGVGPRLRFIRASEQPEEELPDIM